jgi:hypothetical protein
MSDWYSQQPDTLESIMGELAATDKLPPQPAPPTSALMLPRDSGVAEAQSYMEPVAAGYNVRDRSAPDAWKKYDDAQLQKEIAPHSYLPYGVATQQEAEQAYRSTGESLRDWYLPTTTWGAGLTGATAAAAKSLPGPAKLAGLAAGFALSPSDADASFLKAPPGKLLSRAEKLLSEGMDVRGIWDRTGLFQGADGIWRYEVPDLGSRWLVDPAKLVGEKNLKLGDVFEHKNLFPQAPWLPETKLTVTREHPDIGGGFLHADPAKGRPNEIEVNVDYKHDTPHSVVMHEGTHVTQFEQDLNAGTNVNTHPLSKPAQDIYEQLKRDFQNPPSAKEAKAQGLLPPGFTYKRFMKEYEAAKNADPVLLDNNFRRIAANKAYGRSAGENEAENVQFRANREPEYLINVPPPVTEQVPREKQIVTFNNMQRNLPGLAMGGLAEQPQLAKKITGFSPSPGFPTSKPILDASGAPIKGAAFTKQSRNVLDEIAAGEKGAGPMDLSGILRSDVPQTPMERYVPKHGVTDRLADAIANKKVQQGVRESVETGLKFGADKWYHNEPVRREFIKELGEVRGPIEYARFMDMVAATSPRSDVPTNIRNASFYYMMSGKKGLPEELPYPYGHVAQNLHRQNYATVTSPEGWDIFKNTKPASFSANLQGNLVPGTMDTHAFRNIGMRTKDPRFLETSVSAKYKQGTDPAKDTIVNKYGERTGDTVVFRPQELHEGGKLKMKDALQIPYFWSAKPRANEYGAAEKFYSEVGRDFKLPTADAQGAAWAGGGQLTGLGTVPTHTFPQLLNERILYTAKMRGEDPSKTLSDFIRKKAPLLVVPVAGAVGAAKMGGIADQGEYQ